MKYFQIALIFFVLFISLCTSQEPGDIGDQGDSVFHFHKTEYADVEKEEDQNKYRTRGYGEGDKKENKKPIPSILDKKIPLLERNYLNHEGIERIFESRKSFNKFYHNVNEMRAKLDYLTIRAARYLLKLEREGIADTFHF